MFKKNTLLLLFFVFLFPKNIKASRLKQEQIAVAENKFLHKNKLFNKEVRKRKRRKSVPNLSTKKKNRIERGKIPSDLSVIFDSPSFDLSEREENYKKREEELRVKLRKVRERLLKINNEELKQDEKNFLRESLRKQEAFLKSSLGLQDKLFSSLKEYQDKEKNNDFSINQMTFDRILFNQQQDNLLKDQKHILFLLYTEEEQHDRFRKMVLGENFSSRQAREDVEIIKTKLTFWQRFKLAARGLVEKENKKRKHQADEQNRINREEYERKLAEQQAQKEKIRRKSSIIAGVISVGGFLGWTFGKYFHSLYNNRSAIVESRKVKVGDKIIDDPSDDGLRIIGVPPTTEAEAQMMRNEDKSFDETYFYNPNRTKTETRVTWSRTLIDAPTEPFRWIFWALGSQESYRRPYTDGDTYEVEVPDPGYSYRSEYLKRIFAKDKVKIPEYEQKEFFKGWSYDPEGTLKKIGFMFFGKSFGIAAVSYQGIKNVLNWVQGLYSFPKIPKPAIVVASFITLGSILAVIAGKISALQASLASAMCFLGAWSGAENASRFVRFLQSLRNVFPNVPKDNPLHDFFSKVNKFLASLDPEDPIIQTFGAILGVVVCIILLTKKIKKLDNQTFVEWCLKNPREGVFIAFTAAVLQLFPDYLTFSTDFVSLGQNLIASSSFLYAIYYAFSILHPFSNEVKLTGAVVRLVDEIKEQSIKHNIIKDNRSLYNYDNFLTSVLLFVLILLLFIFATLFLRRKNRISLK